LTENNNTTNSTEIIPTAIEHELKRSYLDYSMSVIVSRAIPDVRDGLKPVHRRILFSMIETGLDWNKPYKKSARIVGDVMAKYHPHGDTAIYDSLVRMAQPFSLKVPLVDGQGNFGSMDGDPPAAMRYTESRLSKPAHLLLDDIGNDTVDFQENYDGSEEEPKVLPAKFPNLLVNGAGGIAVGMATNIPTHNLGEVLDACCAYIDNENITIEELMEHVKAPDFPTGGIILGMSGAQSAFLTGRGSVKIRGKAEVEQYGNNCHRIVISEIPYQVNKAKLVEKIADLVREKRVEGISDLRDESDKSGVRVVVDVKKDAFPDVILNQLYSYTPLQVSFGVNMLALDHGKPKLLNLKDIITSFIEFREIVVTRRLSYLLNKARERAHNLIGLFIAVINIDEVIKLVRGSKDGAEAKIALMERKWPAKDLELLVNLVADSKNKLQDDECYLTEQQAKAILDMKLQRLTGLEKSKIEAELQNLANEISGYLDLLASRAKLMLLIRDELVAIKNEFAVPRKTAIDFNELEEDIESLIPKEDMVVTVTHGGYIKRVPLNTYRAQKRGGKGRSGITMRQEDVTIKIFVANTHTPVLFFSNFGKVYKLKVYKLPLATPQSKGRSLVNLFPLTTGETINEYMPLPENEDTWDSLFIFFATKFGNVRRNSLSDFRSIQSNGKIAMKLSENDMLVGVQVCSEIENIFLASKEGQCVRFPVEAVRIFKGRTSDGVRGMRLSPTDQVISLSIINSTNQETAVKEAYLKIPHEIRTQIAICENIEEVSVLLSDLSNIELDHDLIHRMAKNEQFILTITENGFGKRTSAYEYRVTNRGGSGVTNIITSNRNGNVVSSNVIEQKDQMMLITDKGTIIRCPVHDVRITSRNTQGVVLFKTSENEIVVSSERITVEDDEEEDNIENNHLDTENTPDIIDGTIIPNSDE
jgi:DNA gyrase subunit A